MVISGLGGLIEEMALINARLKQQCNDNKAELNNLVLRK